MRSGTGPRFQPIELWQGRANKAAAGGEMLSEAQPEALESRPSNQSQLSPPWLALLLLVGGIATDPFPSTHVNRVAV
jgi:hypothetical protein